MTKVCLTPSTNGAEKGVFFFCTKAHTDVQPCFSFLMLYS